MRKFVFWYKTFWYIYFVFVIDKGTLNQINEA